MKRFNWRHIPDELHQAIKVRAAQEGLTMEQLIEEAVTLYPGIQSFLRSLKKQKVK